MPSSPSTSLRLHIPPLADSPSSPTTPRTAKVAPHTSSIYHLQLLFLFLNPWASYPPFAITFLKTSNFPLTLLAFLLSGTHIRCSSPLSSSSRHTCITTFPVPFASAHKYPLTPSRYSLPCNIISPFPFSSAKVTGLSITHKPYNLNHTPSNTNEKVTTAEE